MKQILNVDDALLAEAKAVGGARSRPMQSASASKRCAPFTAASLALTAEPGDGTPAQA